MLCALVDFFVVTDAHLGDFISPVHDHVREFRGVPVFSHFMWLELAHESFLMQAALTPLVTPSFIPWKLSLSIHHWCDPCLDGGCSTCQASRSNTAPAALPQEVLGKNNVALQGESGQQQRSPSPLGEAQSITHTDGWPPRELDPWIRKRLSSNDGEKASGEEDPSALLLDSNRIVCDVSFKCACTSASICAKREVDLFFLDAK